MSMKLTLAEVEHIAQLARLGLTEAEKKKFAVQISSILDYVNQLKEVDTSGVEPTAQVTGLENVLRPDVIVGGEKEVRKKLLEQAPEIEDDLVKTRAVFE